MASPEQLARFFSALQFDQEPGTRPVSGSAEVSARLATVPPVVHKRPEPVPQYVIAKRDPYRPIDPAWFIMGALVLSLVFAAMKLGMQ